MHVLAYMCTLFGAVNGACISDTDTYRIIMHLMKIRLF